MLFVCIVDIECDCPVWLLICSLLCLPKDVKLTRYPESR